MPQVVSDGMKGVNTLPKQLFSIGDFWRSKEFASPTLWCESQHQMKAGPMLNRLEFNLPWRARKCKQDARSAKTKTTVWISCCWIWHTPMPVLELFEAPQSSIVRLMKLSTHVGNFCQVCQVAIWFCPSAFQIWMFWSLSLCTWNDQPKSASERRRIRVAQLHFAWILITLNQKITWKSTSINMYLSISFSFFILSIYFPFRLQWMQSKVQPIPFGTGCYFKTQANCIVEKCLPDPLKQSGCKCAKCYHPKHTCCRVWRDPNYPLPKFSKHWAKSWVDQGGPKKHGSVDLPMLETPHFGTRS